MGSEEDILVLITMTVLEAAGFAIGHPRAKKICEDWAKIIIKTLQSTDPKYTKVLVKDE